MQDFSIFYNRSVGGETIWCPPARYKRWTGTMLNAQKVRKVSLAEEPLSGSDHVIVFATTLMVSATANVGERIEYLTLPIFGTLRPAVDTAAAWAE